MAAFWDNVTASEHLGPTFSARLQELLNNGTGAHAADILSCLDAEDEHGEQ